MAIFNNSDVSHKNSSTDDKTTIITAGSKIKGEVELSCNLYIDGEVEGTINSSKEVNVGKNGHVKGTIITNRLVVQGYVEGSIDAQRVEIKSTGRIKGEVSSVEFVIESKGLFEGNSILKKSEKSKK